MRRATPRRTIEELKAQIAARAKEKSRAKMGRNVVATAKVIKAFAATRWYEPTVRRYHEHVEACERLDCKELIERFPRFVEEVLSSPEEARDGMLAIEELEPYTAFQRYPAYVEPTKEEQQ